MSLVADLLQFSLILEVQTRSEPGSTLRSGPLTLGPRTCKYGSGPPSHRTKPRTCGFGSVRTPVQKGPDRTVDSIYVLRVKAACCIEDFSKFTVMVDKMVLREIEVTARGSKGRIQFLLS